MKPPAADQSSSSITNKLIKHENKLSEASSSGPNTSSIQSYEKPTFSNTTSALSTTASSPNNYKHYSTVNTTKVSPVDKTVKSEEISASSSTVSTKEDDTTLYKSISYTTTTPSSNTVATKTVSVKTNGSNGKTTVTNNFKLPPFPIYIPSTSLPSQLSHDSGLSSKLGKSAASKYNDSPESSSTTYATTLGRLSSSTSSASETINTVNTTSTLPLHLGRNNPYLYQSESNFNSSNVASKTTATEKSNPSISFASPVSSFSSSQSNYNNVYSTLPKTTSSSSPYVSEYDSNNTKLSTNISSYKYSTDYYSNLTSTTNNTNNGASTHPTGTSDSSNMYRVQYSATNPFLDPVEPSTTDNISYLLRGSVSETKKKFEKLDSGEDLK